MQASCFITPYKAVTLMRTEDWVSLRILCSLPTIIDRPTDIIIFTDHFVVQIRQSVCCVCLSVSVCSIIVE